MLLIVRSEWRDVNIVSGAKVSRQHLEATGFTFDADSVGMLTDLFYPSYSTSDGRLLLHNAPDEFFRMPQFLFSRPIMPIEDIENEINLYQKSLVSGRLRAKHGIGPILQNPEPALFEVTRVLRSAGAWDSSRREVFDGARIPFCFILQSLSGGGFGSHFRAYSMNAERDIARFSSVAKSWDHDFIETSVDKIPEH